MVYLNFLLFTIVLGILYKTLMHAHIQYDFNTLLFNEWVKIMIIVLLVL